MMAMRLPYTRIRIFLILALSMPLLFYASCERADVAHDGKAERIEGTIPDYWPLEKGNEWTYKCTDSKAGSTYERRQFIEDFDGHAIKYVKVFPGDEQRTASFVLSDENTLAKFKEEDWVKSTTFEPPLIFFLTNRKTGTEVTYETTSSLFDARLKHAFTIVGKEDIGAYKNAVKVNSRLEDINSGRGFSEDVWWVKGIGRVKWVTRNPSSTVECVLLDGKLKQSEGRTTTRTSH